MTIDLKIAEITLRYKYNHDDFVTDKIKQYALTSNEQPKYHLEVIITPAIEKHPGTYRQAGNREYFFSKDLDVICGVSARDQGTIFQQVVFDKLANSIKIYISPEHFENVAMQEYIMSGLAFLSIAEREGYLPLHASAIAFREEALLFSAPSQTGKSTQARLWKTRFPDEVRYINDDKPLLYEKDGTIYVSGTPFSGSSPLNANISLPLKALFFLQQGKNNELVRLGKEEFVPLVLRNIMRPKEKEIWDNTLKLIEKIIDKAPVYLFTATPDQDAVEAVYREVYCGGKR
jgi:hypothetical protein